MKVARTVLVVVALLTVAIAGDSIYERRVVSQAEQRITAWMDGNYRLFMPQHAAQEKMFREHCSKGVTKIEVGEAEWRYVEFRVWNAEQKAFLVTAYRSGHDWLAQAIPLR
jgi:hypothetical protein